MTAPDWLNEIVRGFGRQMGLQNFGLNDRGAAGVTFENGIAVKLEYAAETLIVRACVPCGTDAASLRRLLQAAHPGAVREGVVLRAARIDRTGEGFFAARIPERAVTVTEVERLFRIVWEAAVAFRRTAA